MATEHKSPEEEMLERFGVRYNNTDNKNVYSLLKYMAKRILDLECITGRNTYLIPEYDEKNPVLGRDTSIHTDGKLDLKFENNIQPEDCVTRVSTEKKEVTLKEANEIIRKEHPDMNEYSEEIQRAIRGEIDIKPEMCEEDCVGPHCEGCRKFTPKREKIIKSKFVVRPKVSFPHDFDMWEVTDEKNSTWYAEFAIEEDAIAYAEKKNMES